MIYIFADHELIMNNNEKYEKNNIDNRVHDRTFYQWMVYHFC